MGLNDTALLAKIDAVIALHEAVHRSSKAHGMGLTFIDGNALGRFRAGGMLLLEDLFGAENRLYKDFAAWTENATGHDHYKARGIIDEARQQVSAGWLAKTKGLIAADLFCDFLEMAQHLLDEGYKDAAAVISGSTLEAHLKRLAVLAGVAVTFHNPRGDTVHKKADTLNADLVKTGVYTLAEQKQITAWLGIRNDAAHGDYAKVLADMVRIMIAGIRDFTVRHPA